MYSIVHRVLTALLFGLAALGHASAWYQVGYCETDGRPEGRELSGDEPACCSRHLCAEESLSDSPEPLCDDSGYCALCQSLAVACGVSRYLRDMFQVARFGWCVPDTTKSVSLTVCISIMQTRGPPVFAQPVAFNPPQSLCLSNEVSGFGIPIDAPYLHVQTGFTHFVRLVISI